MKLFRYSMILVLAAAGLVTVTPALPVHAAGVTLKGDVFASNGQPALGVTVCALGPSNVCVATSPANSSNDSAACPTQTFDVFVNTPLCAVYEFDNLPTGNYVLQVKAAPGAYDNSSVFGHSFAYFSQQLNLISTQILAVSQNTNLNLKLPEYPVSVHVKDNTGADVSGMPLDASAQNTETDLTTNPAGRRIILGDSITSVTLTSPGAFYQSAPAVSFGGGGSGAAAIATISGPVAAATIISGLGATGYTPNNVYPINFTGCGGSGAVADIETDGTGKVVAAFAGSPGSGYTCDPTATLSGGSADVTVQGLINGTVQTLTLTNGGAGYNPATVSVSFSGGTDPTSTVTTTQATATATVGLSSNGTSSYDSTKADQVTTDGSGNATLWLLPSTHNSASYEYSICGDPATDSAWGPGCATTTSQITQPPGAPVDVVGPTPSSVTVIVPRKVWVSGYVLDPFQSGPGNTTTSADDGVAGVKVCLLGVQGQNGNPNGISSACTKNPTSNLAGQDGQVLHPSGQCDSGDSTGLFTFASGCPYSYKLQVVPGSYDIQLTGDYGNIAQDAKAPQSFSIITTTPVVFGQNPSGQLACGWSDSTSGSSVAPSNYFNACWPENLTIPEQSYAVHVQDGGGTAIGNMPLDASSNTAQIGSTLHPLLLAGEPVAAQSTYDSSKANPAVTDGSGNSTLYLFPSSRNDASFNYSITANPPSPLACQCAKTSVTETVGSANTGATITLIKFAQVKGQILAADGTPASSVTVSLEKALNDSAANQVSSVVTDANGNYTLFVAPGSYYLRVAANPGDGQNGAAQTLLLQTAPVKVGTATAPTLALGSGAIRTLNLTLPEFRVDVKTLAGASPVAGSSIDVQSTCPQTNLPLSAASVGNTGGVASIVVTAGGHYTKAPAVSFSGGGGSGAAATAVLNSSGAVTSVTVTNPGSNYTSAPLVHFSTLSGSGAVATAVAGIGGTGCSTYDHTAANPAVTSGEVASVNVGNQGSGYISPPIVTFGAPGGSGTTASGFATVNGSGNVTGITITNPGSGYASAPSVTISPPPAGTAATATSSIDTFATLWLLDTHYAGQPYTFAANPSSGPYVTTTLADQAVTQDMTVPGGNPVVINLQTPVHFGGTIYDGDGAPNGAGFVTVALLNQPTTQSTTGQTGPANVVESAQTDANGNFTFANPVPPASYYLLISAQPADNQMNAPQQFSIETATASLNLTSDNTSFTLTLPEHSVALTVQDPRGAAFPVQDSAIAAQAACLQNGLTATASTGTLTFNGCSIYSAGLQDPTMTDSAGHATIWLLNSASSPYSIEAHPPAGSTYLLSNINNVPVTADQSQTITLAIPVTITGTILDGHGVNGVGNVNVSVEDGIHGSVNNVIITNPGAGYASAPTVTFSVPGAGGIRATGTATVTGGAVTGVTITNGGAGYISPPTITLTGAHTTAAVAVAKITTAPALAMTTTANDGTFSFVAPSGTHNLKISANPGAGQTGAAQTLTIETLQGLAFTQDTNLGAITVPEKQVTVHVQSVLSPIVPLSGVKLSAQSTACPETGTPAGSGIAISAAGGAQSSLLNGQGIVGCSTYNAFAPGAATTDGTGNATLWLLPSTTSTPVNYYRLIAYPPSPATPQYLQGTLINQSITADMTKTFSLSHR